MLTKKEISLYRTKELVRLRKYKPGRPYQPCKHYTRDELNKLRDQKLDNIVEQLEIIIMGLNTC